MTATGELMLDNLRVIDCGTWVAAPSAATVLGDFGADVVKVEAPPGGDTYRWCAQYIPGFPRAADNYVWDLTARNKRSVLVDLKTEGGYEILLRLVRGADVFVTNFPPEVLEKLRLRFEDLRAYNPRLVYAQLSGYGEKGPDANLPGFDRTGWWARSGMMDRMRQRGHAPAGGIFGWGDHASGMSLFGAIMLGLYRRERTGSGSKVSTSLLANGIWANGIPLQARLAGAEVGLETPHAEMDNALAIPYESSDGHWFYPWLFNEETDWLRFVDALGLGELATDGRFAETPARRANAAALIEAIARRVAERDWPHWRARMAEAGIDLINVSTLDDVIHDPQIAANEGIVPLADPAGVATRTINSPVFVEGQSKRPAGRPPGLGEHNRAVLLELGYDAGEIAALAAAGVFGKRG